MSVPRSSCRRSISRCPAPNFEDTEVDAGLDLRAGLAVFPLEPFGMFLEYRHTEFEAEYSDHVGVANVPASASPEFSTHFVQAGLSFRF